MLLTVAGLTMNPAVMVTLQAFVKEELGRNSGDAAPLLAMMGLGIAVSSVVNQGLIQANTPQALMGRVMGLFTLVQIGLMPIGALGLGLLASAIGIGVTMSAAALFTFVVVVATYVRAKDLKKLR